MPPGQFSQSIEASDDWLLIEEAVGDAVRASMNDVTEEPLPGCLALLLLRIAFAELVRDIARREANRDLRQEDLRRAPPSVEASALRG